MTRRSISIRVAVTLLVCSVTTLHDKVPAIAQQTPSKSVEDQIISLDTKMESNMTDIVSVLRTLPEPFSSTDDLRTWKTVTLTSESCMSTEQSLNDTSAMIHMYKSMNSKEQAYIKPYLMVEMQYQRAVIDRAYETINDSLNAPGISLHPGLVDDLTTAKSDLRNAQQLLKSDALLTD